MCFFFFLHVFWGKRVLDVKQNMLKNRYTQPNFIYLMFVLGCTVLFPLWNPLDCSPPGSSVHRSFSGKRAGVASHFLLQKILQTQRSNPCSCVSCIAGRFFTAEPSGSLANLFILSIISWHRTVCLFQRVLSSLLLYTLSYSFVYHIIKGSLKARAR